MKFILTIVLSLFLVVPIVFAENVLIQWDENIETNLAGYYLWQSNTSSGPYTNIATILPNEFDLELLSPEGKDRYYITNLADGVYFWVLSAFNTEVPSLESGYSNEVTKEIVNPVLPSAPEPPTGLTIQ